MPSHLADPPLSEVVCGFVFEPIPGLDPVAIGSYWAERRAEYPTKQLQPPVVDRSTPPVIEGFGPIRTWLISAADEYVVQIQAERFYVNWRKRQERYPHFNTYGKEEGVLDRCLREWDLFARFCEGSLGRRPTPNRLELAKIDVLLQAKHWKDFEDLTRAVPMLAGTRHLLTSNEPIVQLRLFEKRDDLEVNVSLNNAILTSTFARGVQIETRIASPSSDSPRTTFQTLNTMANDLFFRIVPASELHRFGGEST
jgi:uncharacterized protein (TIGR04255 family)